MGDKVATGVVDGKVVGSAVVGPPDGALVTFCVKASEELGAPVSFTGTAEGAPVGS